jgi:DNA polymerase III delta prime subunit
MAINLAELQKTTQHPPIIILYGPEGTGKSTTANRFPATYWLNAESSTHDFEAYEEQVPKTYTELLDHLEALAEQPHNFRTLIIDTLDKVEIMMTAHLCARNNWTNITDPAYGKGYAERSAEFQHFWSLIKDINERRGMAIILIAHSQIVKVEDPILPAYDKHTLQLYKTENAFIRREADLIGYCMIETYTQSSDGTRNLATTAGKHVIKVRPHPAYDAKTRKAAMPDELDMSADAILQYYKPNRTQNKETKKEE